MICPSILNLSAIAAVGLAAPLSTAVGQQKSIKEQIIGTWTFVSALDVQPGGNKTDRWGSNPKGIFMFDPHGHFGSSPRVPTFLNWQPGRQIKAHPTITKRFCRVSLLVLARTRSTRRTRRS